MHIRKYLLYTANIYIIYVSTLISVQAQTPQPTSSEPLIPLPSINIIIPLPTILTPPQATTISTPSIQPSPTSLPTQTNTTASPSAQIIATPAPTSTPLTTNQPSAQSIGGIQYETPTPTQFFPYNQSMPKIIAIAMPTMRPQARATARPPTPIQKTIEKTIIAPFESVNKILRINPYAQENPSMQTNIILTTCAIIFFLVGILLLKPTTISKIRQEFLRQVATIKSRFDVQI